jgi:hypothetical protein
VEARQLVENIWELNSGKLKTMTIEEYQSQPVVMVYEKFRSTEEFYDVPETYVWVKVGQNRYR